MADRSQATPINRLTITRAMLRMSRRDDMWMFRKDVMDRARKGETLDKIAIDLLGRETS